MQGIIPAVEKVVAFESARLLSQSYGGNEANLQKVESAFRVRITARDVELRIEGAEPDAGMASDFLGLMALARQQGLKMRDNDFDKMLHTGQEEGLATLRELFENPLVIQLKRKSIVPKTLNQKRYLQSIRRHDVAFGIGPAGTGKTYLAMAAALESFVKGEVEKLVFTRPAVEAGEALGFLPGDLQEKILPYLRPLYDALYDMIGMEEAQKLMERRQIEIAPLAYMRGRTLSRSFVILDEAQNTSPEQMMMFLTRLGDDSRMVITGDVTQVDLPRNRTSGLRQAVDILEGVAGISLFFFNDADVVRHPLVQRIIEAYGRHREESATA